MSAKKYILINHPRFGLCNKLINWAKAYVWSQNNKVELIVTGWTHFPIGSILRGDKSLRWYKGFFYTSPWLPILHLLFRRKKIITSLNQKVKDYKYYSFKSTPYISDFVELADYREQITKAFNSLIQKSQFKLVAEIEPPIIGIHVRRGDFVKNGSAINLDYYISVIQSIRTTCKKNISVTIFSDGHPFELEPLLKLQNVTIFSSRNDLIDLLILSRSKILVTSNGSSYSYWAAFINEGIIIHHPKTWVPECRPPRVNKYLFEGPFPANGNWNKLAEQNIKSLAGN